MRVKQPRLTRTPDFVFVKASAKPHFAIRRVGVKAGQLFAENLDKRSIQSHFFIRAVDETSIEDLLERFRALDLENSKVKYNTAANPSLSKHEICTIYMSQVHLSNDDEKS